MFLPKILQFYQKPLNCVPKEKIQQNNSMTLTHACGAPMNVLTTATKTDAGLKMSMLG